MEETLSLEQLSNIVRGKYPDLSVVCNKFSGAIYYNGMIRFNTNGPASESVISAYLFGIIASMTFLK